MSKHDGLELTKREKGDKYILVWLDIKAYEFDNYKQQLPSWEELIDLAREQYLKEVDPPYVSRKSD